MTQLTEQTVFAGRYQFQRLLGRGGFSEVWLAIDKMTNLEIAIKVYAPGQGMDADGMKDFCKELSQVYNLNHTNLVKPQHVDNWEGMPYLVMAYCPKGSCHRQIGAMSEEQIWRVLHDVASGLAYLHDQGIIHQDIKPDNILIDPLGNYVITDFGISIQSRSTLRKSMNIATGSGTTAYMGPERFSKDPKPVKASDIWSLGATIYELLTGNTPFGEIGGGMQKGGADIPTIKQNISPALRQVIALMLSEEPWDRPSAALLADWAADPSTVEYAIKNLAKPGMVVSDGFLKITPQAFDVEPVGGEQLINVKTTEQWQFYSDTNIKWYKVTKESDEVLKIKYEANQTGEDRTSAIRIIAGARAATINLVQKSLPKPNKKPLYITLSVIAVMLIIMVVGFVAKNVDDAKRIKKLVELYNVETEKSTVLITSMSYRDNEKRLSVPVMSIAKVQDMEHIPHFSKTHLEPLSESLLVAYQDSLKSIQAKLDKEIAIEKSYLSAGEETTWLKDANIKKARVDNILTMFGKGYSVQEVANQIIPQKR